MKVKNRQVGTSVVKNSRIQEFQEVKNFEKQPINFLIKS